MSARRVIAMTLAGAAALPLGYLMGVAAGILPSAWLAVLICLGFLGALVPLMLRVAVGRNPSPAVQWVFGLCHGVLLFFGAPTAYQATKSFFVLLPLELWGLLGFLIALRWSKSKGDGNWEYPHLGL